MAGRGRPRIERAECVKPVCMDGTVFDHCECFGERLEMMIYKRDLTIKRFSEMCGIDDATLHGYIRYGHLPNIERGYVIAYALKVDPRWLFGYTATLANGQVEGKSVARWEFIDKYYEGEKRVVIVDGFRCTKCKYIWCTAYSLSPEDIDNMPDYCPGCGSMMRKREAKE